MDAVQPSDDIPTSSPFDTAERAPMPETTSAATAAAEKNRRRVR